VSHATQAHPRHGHADAAGDGHALEFDAVSLDETMTWLIGFAGRCRVVEPAQLDERIERRPSEVARQYEP